MTWDTIADWLEHMAHNMEWIRASFPETAAVYGPKAGPLFTIVEHLRFRDLSHIRNAKICNNNDNLMTSQPDIEITSTSIALDLVGPHNLKDKHSVQLLFESEYSPKILRNPMTHNTEEWLTLSQRNHCGM